MSTPAEIGFNVFSQVIGAMGGALQPASPGLAKLHNAIAAGLAAMSAHSDSDGQITDRELSGIIGGTAVGAIDAPLIT